ncbi:Hypothetical protein CINCED_3A022350 [Cinara cedri]|uniref:P-loop containing nucleoside triphosphate hydrolase n=1 Tax=Cinara cedri TaxID=506608 RepID=A0A5E4MQ27_9HEMI|nr:Hypothetical protein CINCED_3A022350 [Cinara cedri]
MLYTKCLLLYSGLIFFKSTTVFGIIDPITGAFALGSFALGYFLTKTNYSFLNINNCPTENIQFYELQRDIEENFFGQHIASKIILSALKGNFIRSTHNKKPLVMSFHGWTGCGKNFITELIANHFFTNEKMKKLRYHVINRQSQFISSSKLNYNSEELYNHIKLVIKSCKTNIFVFDELQYIPIGLLDILIPILENHDLSIDSRNSIFIFLTNAGGEAIVEKYLELWDKGYSREQMKVFDFDSILQQSAFNEIGGLKKSQLIDSHIIDHYIPFLPLEKSHVMQCIDAELRNLNQKLDSKTKK